MATRRLAAALAVLAGIAVAVLLRAAPPTARGPDAAATEFSAGRAMEVVRELAGDGAARVPGSAAGARAVAQIVGRLRAAGLATEVQETFGCGIYGACARVRNVLARLGDPSPGRAAVLLVAHHDSVGAGPGAADDLSGVAVALETARALAAAPALPRPVIVLLTDAEEAGLAGAAAFAEQHRWAAEVGAAINLEARGTTGPSILFDTSGAPPWLPRALRALPRPVTTSLASAVYDLLPNDTDLTVLERHGFPGVNLAFAFGAVRYHTPRDDLAHLDAASVQHQGENALALVRALAAEDLERGGTAERAFFDVLGAAVVSWPHPRAVALAAALAALAAAVLALRGATGPVRRAGWGVAAALAAPAIGAVATALALLALRAGALPRPFVANAAPFAAAAWAAGAGGALAAAALAARRAGREGIFAGAALVFGALSAGLALAVPLASHVAAAPAFAFALSAAARRAPRGARSLAIDALPAVAAAIVLFPPALFLPSLLGAPAAIASAATVALVALPAVSPVVDLAGRARLVPAAAALAVAALLAAVQATLPHATEAGPERLTFAFHEEAGEARWIAEAEHDVLPAAVRAAAAFSPRRSVPLAWQPLRRAFTAPAPPAGLAPPRLEVLSAERAPGTRRLRARLVSPRGAPVVLLLLPPSARLATLSVGGVALPEPPRLAAVFYGGYRLAACVTAPPEGVLVEIALAGDAPIDAILADQSPGLPPTGAALTRARPPTAVPSWHGDVTLATARVKL